MLNQSSSISFSEPLLNNKTRFEVFLSHHYPAVALFSALLFGCFNFVVYLVLQQYGTGQSNLSDMRLYFPIFVGFLGLTIIYRSCIQKHEYQAEKAITQNFSIYWHHDGTLHIANVTITACKQVATLFITYGLFEMFNYAEQAHLSGAIIVSIKAATPVITAVLFYFIFDESLFLRHYACIGIIITGVITIAVGAQEQQDQLQRHEELEEPLVKPWVPICYAVFTCICISIMNPLSRMAKVNGFTQFQLNADSTLGMGIVYLVGFIYEQIKEPYVMQEFMPAAIVSVFYVMGIYLINLAYAYGRAGPASALYQCQVFFQLVLELMFLQVTLNSMQVIGMILILLSATYIALKNA